MVPVQGRRVRVEFDADQALLPVVRSVAASLAMVEDFTVDDIADVRLAVDEMCSTLITHARPGCLLACQLDSGRGRMAVRGSVDADPGDGPDHDTLSWEIMSVLADTVTSEVAGGRLVLSLTKRRGDV
ncbi:ATP-binding protein [Actinokineospora bangkokensis]|uniref:Histidine kinase/HSP90-like ATPase domain-containing protein n=1 Tax=Actinokineospora bangkokensis TaxID=1193682 RepID=A0A1Q9LIW8_9PSEU|nr:ATP-binding protein [Actinokineospora bangkokensis]OLR91997.1 hypothetical protein BJP25_24595 [Actinokineospora bangkokensis]